MRNVMTEKFFNEYNIDFEFKDGKYYVDNIHIAKNDSTDIYDLVNIHVRGDVIMSGLMTSGDNFFINCYIGGNLILTDLDRFNGENILVDTIIGGDIILPQLTIVDGSIFSNRFINGNLYIPNVRSLVDMPIINSVIVGELTLSNSYKRGNYYNVLQNVLLVESEEKYKYNSKNLRLTHSHMNKRGDIFIDVKYDDKLYEDFSIVYDKEERVILQPLNLSWLNLRSSLYNLDDITFNEDVEILIYNDINNKDDDKNNYRLFKNSVINKKLILYTNDRRDYREIVDSSMTFGREGCITIVEYDKDESPIMITPINKKECDVDVENLFKLNDEELSIKNEKYNTILKEVIDNNKKIDNEEFDDILKKEVENINQNKNIKIREDNINNDYILNDDYVYYVKSKTLIKHSAIIHFNHDDEEQIINIIYDSGTALKIEFDNTFDLYMGVVNLLIELIFNKENIK